MCLHVQLKTSRGCCCQRWEQHIQWFPAFFRAILCEVQCLHWNITDEQCDFYRLYRCFLPVTLNRPVSEDGYTYLSEFNLNRKPTQSHLMLFCFSTNGKQTSSEKLSGWCEIFAPSESVSVANMQPEYMHVYVLIASAVWRELHSSQTRLWLTDE